MHTNDRPCEVCNKNDVPCTVASSTLGAFSFNYCQICNAIGAEPAGMQDIAGLYITYNSNDDSYYDTSDNLLPIQTKKGKWTTRNAFVTEVLNKTS